MIQRMVSVNLDRVVPSGRWYGRELQLVWGGACPRCDQMMENGRCPACFETAVVPLDDVKPLSFVRVPGLPVSAWFGNHGQVEI